MGRVRDLQYDDPTPAPIHGPAGGIMNMGRTAMLTGPL